MSAEIVDTLVVGGGQAGVAMSEHLSECGVPHLVLERHRIAERWRSERWDSLVTNGPVWHDRFPGMAFASTHPDGFPDKETVAEYFEAYARKIAAPIRCGVEVKTVERLKGRVGFLVETSHGIFEANNVVAAAGPFQCPRVPAIVPKISGVLQIHSVAYRNPDQPPKGAVLIVGASSSGVQIAEELLLAGRHVR
jgi:putative flavoprotein involved in K+ transport